MRLFHPCLLVSGLVSGILFSTAQEPPAEIPRAGFLEMVNLISLREPTFLRLANFDLNGGDPVPAGGSSGLLAIKPGDYEFTVSNAGAKPAELTGRISLGDGRNTVVVCYDVEEENRDGEAVTLLRHTLLVENPENDGARLTLVSLMKRDFLSVRLGQTAITLKEKKPFRHPVDIGDAFVLTHRGRRVDEIGIEDPVHYIAFLYEDPDSAEVALSLIRNEKLEYHPPLDEDDEG